MSRYRARIMNVPQTSGHTLFAEHIEERKKEFFVVFDSPPYFNELHFEGGRRWAIVQAETGAGALEIAEYHHYTGENFELLNGRPEEPKE